MDNADVFLLWVWTTPSEPKRILSDESNTIYVLRSDGAKLNLFLR